MTERVRNLRQLALAAVVLALCSLAPASSAWALAPGQPDPSFASGGLATLGSDTRLFGTTVQSDGKIVAVGAIGFSSASVRLLVVRFTTSGALDPSFGGGQVVGAPGVIGRAVAIQPDGKVVVAGQSTDPAGDVTQGMAAARFTSAGAPDGSFGSAGTTRVLNGDPFGVANALALQGDGKIVLAGGGSIAGGQDQGYEGVGLARLNSNGSPDGGFASGGAEVVDLGRYSVANGVAIQGDGKLVIGGSQRQDLQTTSVLAARFSSNGPLDGSFGSGGHFLQQYASGAAYSSANAVALQPDGKIVLGGGALDSTVGIDALIVRLGTGGTPDGTFGTGGAVKLAASDNAATHTQHPPYGASGVVVSAGGIVAAGYFDSSGVKKLALWGLTGSGAPDTGFGTGGRTVIATAASIAASALAVVPGGNLAVAGETDAALSAPNGFAGRFGGRPVVIPPPPPAIPRVALFGGTGFVSSNGVGGIFLGCFGQHPCSGAMTVSVGHTVIASRPSETINPNDGGIVHITLSGTGRSLLAHARGNHLQVSVTVKDTGGGNTVHGTVTLVEFATSGASPATTVVRSATVALFGHTGFVSSSGVGGIFLGCFGQRPCSGAMTITVGHTVIGSRPSETINPNDGGIVHITLSATGRSLLAHARGNQLAVNVAVKDTDGNRSTGTITLVQFR